MAARREQVRERLRQRAINGLHLGILRPGQRLPSARQMAKELGTDYRLVVAAYRELEREGLVEVRPRSGIFLAATASEPRAALPAMARRVVEILVDEVMAGNPAPDFPERVRRCLETLRLGAACLECNEDQMSFLCHELALDYGLETAGVDWASLAPGGRPPIELRRADLLVSTSFHAAETHRLARTLDKPVVIVTLQRSFRAELARLLEERPVYFVGTDPRFAAKLLVLFGDERGRANLRPVIVGRDPVDEIPPDAAVLLSPSARVRLAGHPLLERAIPPRGYSRETAHQLLTFIVERNLAAMVGEGLPTSRR